MSINHRKDKNTMTVNQLIHELKKLEDKGLGGFEVKLQARDYYNTSATALLRDFQVKHNSTSNGYIVNGETASLWLNADIEKDYADKAPKITYR